MPKIWNADEDKKAAFVFVFFVFCPSGGCVFRRASRAARFAREESGYRDHLFETPPARHCPSGRFSCSPPWASLRPHRRAATNSSLQSARTQPTLGWVDPPRRDPQMYVRVCPARLDRRLLLKGALLLKGVLVADAILGLRADPLQSSVLKTWQNFRAVLRGRAGAHGMPRRRLWPPPKQPACPCGGRDGRLPSRPPS